MALPHYPAELPNPLRDKYGYVYGDGRFRSNNDAGPQNIRGRYSVMPDKMEFATLLTPHHCGIFRRFLTEDVKRAHVPFIIANHIEDGWPMTDEDGNTVLDDNDLPILITSVRVAWFDQMPRIVHRDMDFEVTFTLMVMPS